MNPMYTKLMKQYGGSVPFPILLKASQHKSRNKIRKTRKKKTKKTHYYPGTLLKRKGVLYQLTTDKVWIKI